MQRRAHLLPPRPPYARPFLILAAAAASLAVAGLVMATPPRTEAEYAADPAAMVQFYAHVEAASVSDAIEQLLHEKRYMSHRMQAIFPTKFAGVALTVKLVKQEGADSNALSGMLHALDMGGPGSIYVMQVEDGADIAGMGGLMGTAMFARGFAGAVVDGGVRDLPQLKRIGFPVYALGPVPSTSVGHYRFDGVNVPGPRNSTTQSIPCCRLSRNSTPSRKRSSSSAESEINFSTGS